MKIGPFTPPDVREAILHEITHQSELPVVNFPELQLTIAEVDFLISEGSAIPINRVTERILSPFHTSGFAKPDFVIHPIPMREYQAIPSETPGNVVGAMTPNEWHFQTYQWMLHWNNCQPEDIVVHYYLSFMQIINALRPFWAHQMILRQEGFLLHASAAVHEGRAVVFLGHSGAGKSTCARLTPGRVLSDETVAVRFDPVSGIRVFGTPFGGELFPSALVGESPRFLFVRKSDRNSINPISLRNALPRLLSQVVLYPFAPKSWWETATDLALRLLQECPVEELEARKDGSFWKDCLS